MLQQALREAPRTEFATPSEYFATPFMPRGVEYALWSAFNANCKPMAFPSLAHLSRRIHTERRGETLQMSDEPGAFRDGQRKLVRVVAISPEGERHRLIGLAYLRRQGRDVLTQALRAYLPEARA